MKYILLRVLHRFGYAVMKTPRSALGFQIMRIPRVANPIHLWEENKDFEHLFRIVHSRTLVDRVRLFILYQLAQYASLVSGDVAELGVYKGGSAKLLSLVFNRKAVEKRIFLFDTFSGMPRTNPNKDLHSQGDFGDTSIEDVQTFLGDCNNIVLSKGRFAETLHSVDAYRFCYVHVDCDIYSSVMECCQFFYPRLSPGGIMIFDDYGFISCPGARLAVDEFFADKREPLVYLPTGQCLMFKRP